MTTKKYFNMQKSLALLRKGFVSSSENTSEFSKFYKQFCIDVEYILKMKGCRDIKFSKGHFYATVYFTTKTGKMWYLSISDVRSFTENDSFFGAILYRTVDNYSDTMGGSNFYIKYADLETLHFK